MVPILSVLFVASPPFPRPPRRVTVTLPETKTGVAASNLNVAKPAAAAAAAIAGRRAAAAAGAAAAGEPDCHGPPALSSRRPRLCVPVSVATAASDSSPPLSAVQRATTAPLLPITTLSPPRCGPCSGDLVAYPLGCRIWFRPLTRVCWAARGSAVTLPGRACRAFDHRSSGGGRFATAAPSWAGRRLR